MRVLPIATRAVLTLLAATVLVTSGCAGPDPESGLVVAEDVTPQVVQVADANAVPALVESTRAMGTALLASAPSTTNAVVSPSSAVVALSMLADGAQGLTLGELEAAIGTTGDERRAAVAALRNALGEYDGDPAVVQDDELPEQPVVHLAAQVVVDDQFALDDSYLATLAAWYEAGVQRVDLGADEGGAVLDAWVKHHSGGLVERSALQPSAALRLAIQDAVVLAARWETPFPAYATTDRRFTLTDGTAIAVRTMSGVFDADYVELDGWRAVRLPFAGGALHTDLLLPPAGTDPTAAGPHRLHDLLAALDGAETMQVQVRVPTLDLQPEPLDLRAALRDLGVSTVMVPGEADLSGLGTSADGQPLYLAQAWQQTVLQLGEDGVRAAAVTELGAEAGAAPAEPVVELDLDRPFLIQVAHTATGWPLFQAAVRDPRG